MVSIEQNYGNNTGQSQKKNTDNQMNQSELGTNTWKGPKRGKIWFHFWLVTKVAEGKMEHIGKKYEPIKYS